ncbi:MAG: hypothetical protein XD98_0286 [Microgenomates bacterium 39_6]|nr:MAG: hypothetical protein XD98_0286 [Microgenomates bacterium 39_6]
MKKKANFSVLAYLILILVLLLGAAIFLLLPPLPGKKEGTIIGLSAWYFVWSLWYQRKKGRLDIRIVLEYLVIAFLGAIVLFSLI